jgi:DNA-binding XRE family transcriptional regulator
MKTPRRPIGIILIEARRTLGMSQSEFGMAVGSSHRSAVRWDGGGSVPGDHHLYTLARLLYPHDRSLAAEVADAARETLVSLEIEAAPDPMKANVNLVDLLVLTAVEQSGSLPAAVRPWLHAVMKRGIELGLTMESAELALRPASPEKPAKLQK